MTSNIISTYRTEELKEKFVKADDNLNFFFNSRFNKFFIIREEDLFNFIKAPIPPIRTTSNLLIFISEGSVEMNVGIAKYIVRKNECLVVPPGQVFSMGMPNIPKVKGFFCSFDKDVAIGKMLGVDVLSNFEFLKLWGQHLIKLNETNAVFIANLFERLLTDYFTNGEGNISITQAYLWALLCELNQEYQPLQQIKNNQYTVIANKFKALLYDSSKIQRGVSDYASLLNISSNHLNKVIKQTTGKSTSNWIEEMLIMQAKVLLSQTNLTIQQITADIGIDDPAYFSRMFKKREKITPTQYRKMIEKS